MIEIKSIEPSQVEEAKQVILTVCYELWQPQTSFAAFARHFDDTYGFDDLDDVQNHYFHNGGTFLVLIDNGRVVGMGGVRRLDPSVCELKRMWFLKEYRGQGLGHDLAMRLVAWARAAGYKTMRLDVADEVRNAKAIRLYQRLGFVSIERYNNSSCAIWMEKKL